MATLPYSFTQSAFVAAATVFSALTCGGGSVLLWMFASKPIINGSDISFRLEIIAVPAALLCTLLSLYTHRYELSALRYIVFGLALSYTTQSSFSAATFRELMSSTSSPGIKTIIGFILNYVSLAIMLIAAGSITTRLAPPQTAVRSKQAIASYVLTFILGAGGCGILFWQDSVISTSNITVDATFKNTLYGSITVPTIINLLVLFGGVAFVSPHAAHGSLLIVGSSCFWILSGLFQLQGLVTSSTTLLVVGAALCWASAVTSIVTAFAVTKQYRINASDPSIMDALVDVESREHLACRSNAGMAVAFGCIATCTVLLYLNDRNITGRPNWDTRKSNFLDIEFAMLLVFAICGYLLFGSNYDRSKLRYLAFGAAIFIPHFGTHNVIAVVNNIRNALALHQSDGTYTEAKLKLISIGEILGYFGLIVILVSFTGRFRAFYWDSLVNFLAAAAAVGGTVTILITDHIAEFTFNSGLSASTTMTTVIQSIAVPCVVAAILAYCGHVRTSVEASHAALYTVGFSCYWILTNTLELHYDLNNSTSKQVLIGGLVCLGAAVLVVISALLGIKSHNQEKAS